MEKLELNNRPEPKHDYLEARGANVLAGVIRDYWRAVGATGVKVWVMPEGASDNYGVRSNLVNGLPEPPCG